MLEPWGCHTPDSGQISPVFAVVPTGFAMIKSSGFKVSHPPTCRYRQVSVDGNAIELVESVKYHATL